jgi:hypothetical protein
MSTTVDSVDSAMMELRVRVVDTDAQTQHEQVVSVHAHHAELTNEKLGGRKLLVLPVCVQ